MTPEELRKNFEKETGLDPYIGPVNGWSTEYVKWLEKLLENQTHKITLPAEIEIIKEAGEILNIRKAYWNACLSEIKKLNNWV